MRISDWSSDVCSSDLAAALRRAPRDLAATLRSGEQAAGGRAAGDRRRRRRSGGRPDLDRRAAPVQEGRVLLPDRGRGRDGRKPRSEEHTSELQSLMRISYAVFCLKKKKKHNTTYAQHEEQRKLT